jgi:carboxylesterase type B
MIFEACAFSVQVGGSSVNYHMISPMSQNLFHRGISQSGTLQSFWSDPLTAGVAKERARMLAEDVGCEDTQNSEAIVTCLRNQTVENLVNSLYGTFVSWIDMKSIQKCC